MGAYTAYESKLSAGALPADCDRIDSVVVQLIQLKLSKIITCRLHINHWGSLLSSVNVSIECPPSNFNSKLLSTK
jgi:hypothetical protein